MIKPIKIDDVAQRVSSNRTPKENVAFSSTKGVTIKTVVKEELLSQSKALKWLDYFSKKKGETMNIVVNALGTGLVAPFFIAYNPLSKEDDKTKKYSALRQPVSAILAVITQIGINSQFDKRILDKYARMGAVNGLGKNFDLSPELKIEKLQAAMGKMADEARESAIEKIEKLEELLKKPRKNLGYLKLITGMVLSLLIMPITCSALNWSYPRMVEKFFPSLCKDNKKSGGKNDTSCK